MVSPFEQQIRHGHRLLGHEDGWTELFAKSRYYKPGEEYRQHNREHNAFPKHWYTQDEDAVVAFALKYQNDHTVMYGINPRIEIHRNSRGYPRSARDDDVLVSQNLLLDYDFRSKRPSEAQRSELVTYFLTEFSDYCFDLGFQPPYVVDSGRGANLLMCYEAVSVQTVPDIAAKLQKFASEIYDDHKDVLHRLEVEQDNTQDIGRYLRVLGTAKPDVGIRSRVYGCSRSEDEALRDYLLGMPIPPAHRSADEPVRQLELTIGRELPRSFLDVLDKHERVRELYAGQGKHTQSDDSGSGYDFSLVQQLISLGYTDIAEIATVLAVRPNGSVQKSGKGEGYIRRTIAAVLMKGS